MAIDATPGSTTGNSYVTLAYASTYCTDHLSGTTYLAATSATQETAVKMATKMLDTWVDWIGAKVEEDQALRWPRYNAPDRDGYYFDSDEVPPDVKDGTAELARLLVTSGDTTGDPDTLGFTMLKVGSLQMNIDKSDRDMFGAIPDSVRAFIEPYGTIRSRGGPQSAKVVRT